MAKKQRRQKYKQRAFLIKEKTFCNYLKVTNLVKRSHTCEEGGAHLRISFWNLLMNLKNKLLKKLLKCHNKKQNNFNITMLHLFFQKKRKERKEPVDIIIKILMISSIVPEIWGIKY